MAGSQCPGYYPAAEFHFDEGQADDIGRIAAYHRRDFVFSVIWFPPSEHSAIRQSTETLFHRISTGADVTGLGGLERLPMELVQDIVLRLGMRAVFYLRQANLRAREVVDSLLQYQMVTLHGLTLFCAVLRTGFAKHVSLASFYDALTTKYCTICGNFGGFLFLLTWTRCCFACLKLAPQTEAQTLASLQKELQLNGTDSSQLSALSTLPDNTRWKKRCEDQGSGLFPDIRPPDRRRARLIVLPYQQRRGIPGERTVSTDSWHHALFRITIGAATKSIVEDYVPDVSLLWRKTLLVLEQKIGLFALVTWYTGKMASYSISGAVSRHSSCGN